MKWNKKGFELMMMVLVPLVLALGVLVIVLIFYFSKNGLNFKLNGFIDYIKDLWRFRT